MTGFAQRADAATVGRNDLFDGKLGFIGNVTFSDVDTRQDYASNANWGRYVDFDRSAGKTVVDPAYASFGTYESCAGVSGSTAAVATTNRLACETRFFDWVPRIARYRQRDINDKRLNADLQLQYEVTDTFNVFGQARYTQRTQQLRDTNFSVDLGSDTAGVDGRSFRPFNVDAPLAANAAGGTSRPRVTPGTFTIDEATHTVTSVVTAVNGFNAGTVRAFIADQLGATAQIKANPSRTAKPPIDWPLYKERHQIECFFNRLKRFRRTALRCEKTLPAFMGFVHLACAMIWLR